jgi:hypothetical protein
VVLKEPTVVAYNDRRVWNTGEKSLTWENKSDRRKSFLNVTKSTHTSGLHWYWTQTYAVRSRRLAVWHTKIYWKKHTAWCLWYSFHVKEMRNINNNKIFNRKNWRGKNTKGASALLRNNMKTVKGNKSDNARKTLPWGAFVNHCSRRKTINIKHLCVCLRVSKPVGVRMRLRACSLAYPESNSYAPYCDVICGPSNSTIFFDIIS